MRHLSRTVALGLSGSVMITLTALKTVTERVALLTQIPTVAHSRDTLEIRRDDKASLRTHNGTRIARPYRTNRNSRHRHATAKTWEESLFCPTMA